MYKARGKDAIWKPLLTNSIRLKIPFSYNHVFLWRTMHCCLFFTLALPDSTDCLRWLPTYSLIISWQIPKSSNKNWRNLNLHPSLSIPIVHLMFLQISNLKENLRWRWPSRRMLCVSNQFLVLFLQLKPVPGNMTWDTGQGSRINAWDIFWKARIIRKSGTYQPHVLWNHSGSRIFSLSRKPKNSLWLDMMASR